jgi:hypothetical protein
MVVEDVCLAGEAPGEAAVGGRWVRRLVFEANRSLVQSEAALVPGRGPLDPAPAAAGGAPGGGGAADARKGKKGKKKGGGGSERAGGAGAAATAEAERRVDHSVLCCAYHAAIVAGLALTGGRPRRPRSSLRCAHAAATTAESAPAGAKPVASSLLAYDDLPSACPFAACSRLDQHFSCQQLL